jgi:glycosyltransferase involved in cell wall biosynthesis
MRILQLNFERGWRGGERQTLYCMRRFRDAGHAVSLLARAGGALAARARDEGFEVIEQASLPGVCAYLLRHGRRFNILHAQTANMMTWLAALKPILGGAPIVFTRRTAFEVKHRESRTAWKWRKADVLVAISQAAAAEPRRLGLEVVVIPSAIEPKPVNQAHVDRIRAQFDLAGRKVLATAAALTPDKDPLTLIRAVHVLRELRSDFVFLHCGGGGAVEAQARQLVRELGLEKHYLFGGFQAGIEDIYRIMDGFVISSRSEALGSSVLDAFLYRVPVASTDAGGLKEVLDQGRGLLCPVGDHEALGKAMHQLLNDPSLCAAMVEKAYTYVRAEHDVEIMGQRYLEQFARLLP